MAYWKKLRPGSAIGPFQLIEQLGEGGHAIVYRACSAAWPDVAIKILKRLDSGPGYQRFRDEIVIMLNLSDEPGVLPILDSSLPLSPTQENPPWLAMPIATTIRIALKDSRLDDIVRAMSELADTLTRLHERKIHHRDLKPENLYRHEDRVKVGDFGLVSYPGKTSITDDRGKLGPIHYHAPEMLSNPSTSDGGPADVYSFCKVLWVLATGQTYPLPGEQRSWNLASSIRETITHPRAIMLDGLVDRGTRLNPTARCSMADVSEELAAWLKEPVSPMGLTDLQGPLAFLSANAVPGQLRIDERETRIRAVHELVLNIRLKLEPIAESLESTEGISVYSGIDGAPGTRQVGQAYVERGLLNPGGQRFVEHAESTWIECRGPYGSSLALGFLCQLRGDALEISVQHNFIKGGNNSPLWSTKGTVRIGSATSLIEMEQLLASFEERLPVSFVAFGEELRLAREQSEKLHKDTR